MYKNPCNKNDNNKNGINTIQKNGQNCTIQSNILANQNVKTIKENTQSTHILAISLLNFVSFFIQFFIFLFIVFVLFFSVFI